MNKQAVAKSVDFIDNWLKHQFEKSQVPGMVLTITHKQEIIYNQAFGLADIENKIPMQTDHIFRVASHSKTFTSVAIFQLQEQNKLKIDDYISDYLPWIKKHQDRRFDKITIRQILSHSAGIIRDGLDSSYWHLESHFPDKEKLKQEILASELIFDSNTQLKYSNLGYSLLGLLIEEVSGISYHKFVTKNIIQPLKLKNTHPETSFEIDQSLAVGYSNFEFGKRRPIENISTNAMAAATGICSTGEDLCQFYSALAPESGKLLTSESKKELLRTQWQVEDGDEKSEYAHGVKKLRIKDNKLIGHGGGFPGHITNTLSDHKNDLTISLLINSIDASTRVCYAAHKIFQSINENYREKSKLANYSGRFYSLWFEVEIIPCQDKLITVAPYYLYPFDDLEELKQVDSHTFKFIKAGAYSSNGELVKFNLDKNQKIKSINHTGSTMYTKQDWESKIKSLNKITQEGK